MVIFVKTLVGSFINGSPKSRCFRRPCLSEQLAEGGGRLAEGFCGSKFRPTLRKVSGRVLRKALLCHQGMLTMVRHDQPWLTKVSHRYGYHG